LEVRDVSRRFGYRNVFQGVNFAVGAGEVVSLIGPNGAGKTTLLRVLAGLLRPTSGVVHLRGTLGMVAHHSMLYDALTAEENLAFFQRLRGVPDGKAIGAVLERMGLTRAKDQRVATFSRGMIQRLAVARTLLANPDVILMDEPTSGLDDPACDTVLEVLREMRARGAAVVIVTHQYDRVAPMTTSVGFLHGGRLHGPAADGLDPDVVSQRYRS
jgi:heme exporter protein A